jgi:Arc/MetJ family transcription regulator
MFTSAELDEELFNKAWALSGIKTKRAFLDEALRVYVRLHEQAEVRSLRGKLVWNEPEGKRGAGPR